MNDPVARKMLSRVDAMPKLEKPEDSTITTLSVPAPHRIAEHGHSGMYSISRLLHSKRPMQIAGPWID